MGGCPARQPAAQPVLPVQVRLVQQGPAQQVPSRARRLWHSAVQQIALVLRLRRRWAALGQHLQGRRIQDLVLGLERRQGQLIRRRPAPLHQ